MIRCLNHEYKQKFQNVLRCVLSIFIFFVALRSIFSIIMISPDDIRFQNILSGTYTGTPEAHCYFIQYPLSIFISWLYKIDNQIDWYENTLLFLVSLCFYLMLRKGNYLSVKKQRIYFVAVLLVWGTSFVRCTVELEWTAIAGLLAATAIYLYITMDFVADNKWGDYFICLMLFCLGFCLRKTVMWMYVPLAGMLWFQRSIELKRKQNKNYIHNVCFLIICIISVLTIMVIQFYAYRDKDWQMYNDYTKNRSTIVDYNGYPDYYKYKDDYSDAGISFETYDLMHKDYNYVITWNRDIDLKKIAELSKENNKAHLYKKIAEAFLLMKKTYMRKELYGYNVIFVILFFMNLCMISNMSWNRRLGVAGTILWMFIMSFILALYGRLPYRIAVTIVMGGVAVMGGTLFIQLPDVKTSENRIFWFIVCFNSIIAGQMCWNLFQLHVDNVNQLVTAQARKEIDEYCSLHSENIYIQDFCSFSQYAQYIDTRNNGMESNLISSGGWSYNSPLYYAKLQERGYSNIYDFILNKQNVYYIVSDTRANNVVQRMDIFFDANNIEIKIIKSDEFKCQTGKVAVYQFVVGE